MGKDHGPSVKNDKQYEGPAQERNEQVAGGEDRQHAGRLEEGRQEGGKTVELAHRGRLAICGPALNTSAAAG
jgi:hypothetical protein